MSASVWDQVEDFNKRHGANGGAQLGRKNDGRKGKVFSVRLADDQRAVLDTARVRWNKTAGWTQRCEGIGSFMVAAGARFAAQLLEPTDKQRHVYVAPEEWGDRAGHCLLCGIHHEAEIHQVGGAKPAAIAPVVPAPRRRGRGTTKGPLTKWRSWRRKKGKAKRVKKTKTARRLKVLERVVGKRNRKLLSKKKGGGR